MLIRSYRHRRPDFLSPYCAVVLRTSDKYEIDLILDFGGRLYAIEIKLTSSPDSDDVSRFRKAAEIIEAKRCLLISRTQDYITSENFVSANIQQALEFLMADTR